MCVIELHFPPRSMTFTIFNDESVGKNSKSQPEIVNMEVKDTTATEKGLVNLSQNSSPSKATVASQSKATIDKNSEVTLKE